MTQDQPVIRIGELLVQSGVITAYDLSEAEKLSSHMKVQFGRLLIMAGCLTEEALECALEAQGLIKQGMLTPQIACEALAFAVQENIPLRQSLEMLDCLPQFGTSTLRLAELIHDANIIDEERLHDAFDTSMETNRPLPEVLVEMDCISPGLLSIMLRMQEQIRNETLDRDDSINELRGTFKIWKRADKAMANDPMSKSAIIGKAPVEPIKPSRYTSSFDSVTRLPAMSPEILAGLNKEAAAGIASGASISQIPPPQPQTIANSSALAQGIPAAPNSPASITGAGSNTANVSESRGKSSDPARGGKDDLKVDWILQDYANAPPGQPMPDGVILYSQGYFPPDPNNVNKEEPFNEIFSDEDEQRINDLLDVFANDSSPAISDSGHAVGASSADRYSQSGVQNQSYAGANTNFAQASYSASLAAAAADGWGVPDLAAAGANLSGAEMFARAQAELASSGWAYSQNTASQPGHQSSSQNTRLPEAHAPAGASTSSPQAYTGPGSKPGIQAAPPPGPLGQPSYVTPAAIVPPKGLGHPDFYPGELARTSEPVSPGEPLQFSPAPRIAEPVQPADPADADEGDRAATPAVQELASKTETSVKEPPEAAAAPSEDSLFSPQLRDSISDALNANPFKIRKATGESSSANVQPLAAVGAPEAKSAVVSREPNEPAEKEISTEAPDDQPGRSEIADEDKAVGEHKETGEAEHQHAAEQADTGDSREENSALASDVTAESEPEAPDMASASIDSSVKADTDPSDATASSDNNHENDASKSSEANESERAENTSAKADGGESQTIDAHQPSEPADSKISPESKSAEERTAPEPRGKFGTKTGLAARRKAVETEEGAERNDVVFLLKSANFFTADELEDAVVNCLRDANKAVEILGILGIIDKSNLDAAVRLQKLVKAGSVDVEKAVDSLTNLKSGKIRASELTEQLGIKKSKRRK